MALTFASGAAATTENFKIPAEEFPAADLCNGDQVQLQGTIHLVGQGEALPDVDRQHAHAHFNSQQLSGIGITSGDRYKVNLISQSSFNAHIDGANVTTSEVMMNVVRLGSGENSQLQTVLHTTQNANGEITTQFQNFHVHCQGD